jgi:hypothetical protein
MYVLDSPNANHIREVMAPRVIRSAPKPHTKFTDRFTPPSAHSARAAPNIVPNTFVNIEIALNRKRSLPVSLPFTNLYNESALRKTWVTSLSS